MKAGAECGIVVLAAGASTRLGQPKQMLTYKGKTLIQHAVDTALATGFQPVFVVTGAQSDLLHKELEGKPVSLLENKDWQEGMASSIRCVIEKAQTYHPVPDALIFMVCDQPFVTSDVLLALVKKQKETGLPIVASTYGETVGVPALFCKSVFPDLLALKGEMGAKKVIQNAKEKVALVAFEKGNIDIDTPTDWEKWLSGK